MKAVHWLLMVAVAWWLRQGGAPPVPGNCEHQCGAVAIPFPFGVETNCARSENFLLNCNDTEGSGIQLQWGDLTIRNISVEASTMAVSVPEAYQCYDQNGYPADYEDPLIIDLSTNPRCRFSDTQNKLTVLGCNTAAALDDGQGMFGSSCITFCSEYETNNLAKVTTCSGRGCCQASIPKGLQKLNISIFPLGPNVPALQINRCALAFVADNKLFNDSGRTLPRFGDVRKGEELVLDWMVEPDVTCQKAKLNQSSYACGKNSDCEDFGNGPGYRCVCKPGYNGNPYNPKDGCIDIDECKEPNKYQCSWKCKNTPGNYTCLCRFGMQGNGKGGCRIARWIEVVSALIGAFFFMAVGTLVFKKWQRRRIKKRNFSRNSGELLKHQRVQIFTETELAKATNNYDDSNKLGEGGFGSVYRGTMAGDTVVAVKKPKDVHKSLIKGDFQHELEIVMQINHKNVVKLHGVCLETRIPLLVYEYISNGTLFQHIHQNVSTTFRSWKNRLRIAAEAALALEYMHSCAEPPIIHGDIKSVNILLDQKYSVKVSDFGTSVLISPERSHVLANEIQGTLGYIDPEYLTTGMLTVNSDVYSFGAVLVELLTGKKPTSFVTKSGESINIVHYFISSVKDKTLSDVINFEDTSEDEMERVGMVAEIAVKCLDQCGARRPAMREVAEQLTRINRELNSSTVEENKEETESELDEENLSSLATSITSKMSQHGTSASLFYSAGSSI
ncbi:wall-associated receptor kinase 2-like [Syzygium oleosum]|uniref:wall-associated receptor kinase 2-like n=1 Tax=Syzygium oleosum TaxID=219896 RepID=UPI0011D1CE11|nr:wall-associated receptor kinase 2-like [Syzygium oleosum]